jgi:hypothetical protein
MLLLHFEPLRLLRFDFNTDPDLAFHSVRIAIPIHILKIKADPCGFGSANLLTARVETKTLSNEICELKRYIARGVTTEKRNKAFNSKV